MITLLAWLQANDFKSAGELVVPEDELAHPALEVYAQQCPVALTDSGSVLLTLKQTFLDSKERVRRKLVLQGEVSQNQYLDLMYTMRQKLQPEELEAGV
jgi:hypothetical protein